VVEHPRIFDHKLSLGDQSFNDERLNAAPVGSVTAASRPYGVS
jgi:hypothetical protein